MLIRAEAWHAILRAALPGTRVRRRDTARATMIGVLMSATLPARLGEPSRALILARRVGRVRDRLPVVLGTLVSQTLLNILALTVLGGMMFATVGIFRGGEDALVFATIAPIVLIALLLAAPCAAAPRQAVALRAGAAGGGGRALGDGAGQAGPRRVPPAPARGLGGADAAVRLGGAAAGVLRAARGTGARRARPASEPRRPCCSRSTSRPRCPPPRPTSACSRRPAWRCCPPTEWARPTRWPTGSSCRRWRSRPRWPWACRRWCARA